MRVPLFVVPTFIFGNQNKNIYHDSTTTTTSFLKNNNNNNHRHHFQERKAIEMTKELDFTITHPRNVIDQWHDDNWVCYWKKRGDTKYDEKNYVFHPPLEMSRCGVVRTKHDTLWDDDDDDVTPKLDEATQMTIITTCISNVMTLLEKAEQKGGEYATLIDRCDESDHCWMPFAMHWNSSSDDEFTIDTFLRNIGAHPELRNSVTEWSFDDFKDDDDFEDYDIGFEKKLRKFFSSHLKEKEVLYFCCGDGKLNPVPCFAVGRLCDGLVAGFIGGVTYT
uniref:Uncharacterized protein n=1 Tax=Ditylum brightwellii TaxID=49249 RepID=A0A7S1YN89_9STRA|mmetsp:Transcript_11507/g.17148  ORF Transcript_11507/g.17148 Transcript_11507/m.17148 type:complete len:278 (+) Transcript_11507:89-922(+)